MNTDTESAEFSPWRKVHKPVAAQNRRQPGTAPSAAGERAALLPLTALRPRAARASPGTHPSPGPSMGRCWGADPPPRREWRGRGGGAGLAAKQRHLSSRCANAKRLEVFVAKESPQVWDPLRSQTGRDAGSFSLKSEGGCKPLCQGKLFFSRPLQLRQAVNNDFALEVAVG